MKKPQVLRLFFPLGLVVFGSLVLSCTDFFSTSLAPWAARDPASVIPAEIDAGNVNDLITIAESNPDMSLEILKKINNAVQDAGEEDASSLRAAALQAAANASNLGPTLLNHVGDITSVLEEPADVANLVVDAINDMSNLGETRDALTVMFSEREGPAFDAFIEKANADDLAIAAAVLLAAEAKDMLDAEEYITNFDPAADLSPPAALAVKLATEAAKKYEASNSNSRLKEILDGLHLVVP
jgi:hypothetical protein